MAENERDHCPSRDDQIVPINVWQGNTTKGHKLTHLLANAAAILTLGACSQQPAAEDEMAANAEASTMETAATTPSADSVNVTISGVEAGGGQLFVALQNADQFLAANGAYKTKVNATGTSVTATFDGVAPGAYAAAVIRDQNADGEVGLGTRGPMEAWGLSGAAHSGKPEWMTATFTVTDAGGTAMVTVKYPG